MTAASSEIVVVAPPQVSIDEYRSILAATGFPVRELPYGTSEPIDLKRVKVIVMILSEMVAPAVAQTRLWRAEMGQQPVPILWLLPFVSNDLHVTGLEAGADACLARPVEPRVVLAQVQAMLRARQRGEAIIARAQDVRQLNEQLQRLYTEIDQAFDLARRIQRTLLPRKLPELGPFRLAVHHRPRSRVGGDCYDILRLDEHHLGFWLADAGGPGSPAGGLLGIVVKHSLRLKEIQGSSYRLIPPSEVLERVNRELMELDLDPPALVGMVCGLLDTRDGRVTLARAGIPAAAFLSRQGTCDLGLTVGSLLGAYATEFPIDHGRLASGDRLVLLTDGARPIGDPDPLPGLLAKHQHLHGQEYVDALARDVLSWIPEPDDCTIMLIESEPAIVAANATVQVIGGTTSGET